MTDSDGALMPLLALPGWHIGRLKYLKSHRIDFRTAPDEIRVRIGTYTLTINHQFTVIDN